jgi:protein arginine kinase activator
MTCQICKKHPATVHIIEIPEGLPSRDSKAPSGPEGSNSPEAAPDTEGHPAGTPDTEAHPEGAPDTEAKTGSPRVEKRHLCEACAQNLQLPAASNPPKGLVNIWKLLQKSARKAREEGGLACPDCGMTLAEFRSKGRLGCSRDYETFRQHLTPLLQRIHNSTNHQGRTPGAPAQDLERQRHLTALRAKLDEAIRAEAYENAAELRDKIQTLESQRESAS